MTIVLMSVGIRAHLKRLGFSTKDAQSIVRKLEALCYSYSDPEGAADVLQINFPMCVNKMFSSDQLDRFLRMNRPQYGWSGGELKEELGLYDHDLRDPNVTPLAKANYNYRKAEIIAEKNRAIQKEFIRLRRVWHYSTLNMKNWRDAVPVSPEDMPSPQFIGPSGWNPDYRIGRHRR